MSPRRLLFLLVLLVTLGCVSTSRPPAATPTPAAAPAADDCTPICCCWPFWAKCGDQPIEPGSCFQCTSACNPGTPAGCGTGTPPGCVPPAC